MPDDVMTLPAPAVQFDLPPIQHLGERVLTTELLARAYGVDPDHIHDNHRKNAERFVQGVHFHKVEGAALRAFKDRPENIGLVGAKARALVLWTERGAARHAKMLHTDAAWAVFGRLEETYFSIQAAGAAASLSRAPPLHTGRALVADFRAFASLGPLLGLDSNQAALAANRAVRKLRGVDVLDALGTTHLPSPQAEMILTPSDIGKLFDGRSGQAINAMLALHGFQVGTQDAKRRTYWTPTDRGKPFAVWQDTGKKHGDGTPVRQLKWGADLVDALRAALLEQSPALDLSPEDGAP